MNTKTKYLCVKDYLECKEDLFRAAMTEQNFGKPNSEEMLLASRGEKVKAIISYRARSNRSILDMRNSLFYRNDNSTASPTLRGMKCLMETYVSIVMEEQEAILPDTIKRVLES